MSVVDSAMTREVFRDISKRPLDISQLSVHVTHGIVYLSGRVERLRGYPADIDLHEEMNIIIKILKQKAGIRDVCSEVDLGEASISKRVGGQKAKSHY